ATSASVFSASSSVFGTWRMKGAGFMRLLLSDYMHANDMQPDRIVKRRHGHSKAQGCRRAVAGLAGFN
ncbi:MAG TPA: hypothetical protein VGM57_10455, partial [Pseudolabrys sp.]